MESEVKSAENDAESEINSKPALKDDVEERYNKLKGFAVKLKKKVTDLTEELKVSESEKAKAISEKDEIQKKVLQVSDNLKKLQTMQVEYDKLQDNIEKEKSEKKKISKNLETLILQNTDLKESLYEQKEIVSSLNNELDSRSREITELKSTLKKNQTTIKQLREEKHAETVIREQREKDYEEIKGKLEVEIQLNKTKSAQLDAAKQERNSKNVLFLEVDNYEKSIEDLKTKLSDEITRCKNLEATIDEQRSTIKNLDYQLTELRDSCFVKTNQLTSFSDKNETLKAEVCELKQEITQIVKEKESVLEAMELIKANSEKISRELVVNLAEKNEIKADMENKIKNYVQQIGIFKSEISRLNEELKIKDDEIEAIKNEFEGYKLRAQSVLRTKQIQSKESGLYGQNIMDIEAELNHLRSHSTQQQEKLQIINETVKSLTTELSLAKEERDSARDNIRELGQKLSILNKDYSTLREQCRSQLLTIDNLERELENKEETLKASHLAAMEAAKEKYQREMENLQFEIEKFQISGKSSNDKQMVGINHADRHRSWQKYENEQEEHFTNDMYFIEREEGEGSESVDSYTPGNMNSEKQYNHFHQQLVPLDELLNSSENYTKSTRQILPAKVDRHELELCERRVNYLTVLLADAERDAAKLNQMNQLLKEDIRRQQRSAEREQHANNFEYLKNIIIKFVTLKNGDERSRLIPVLNTILKLSPDETQKLYQVAGGRGWLPSFPIPGWSND